MTGKQVTTLKGHELAVWSVIEVSPGLIVTGAADKTVKMWEKSSATCQSTLTGNSTILS